MKKLTNATALVAALPAVLAGLAVPSTEPPPIAAPPNAASPGATSAIADSSTAAPSARTAATVFAGMSEPQRVGQLFMVGTPATSASPATLRQIGLYHVGNIILTGRSYGGTATPARVVAAMQARATGRATLGVRLLSATDQEGGYVQVLHGPGISEIPTALTQGRWLPSTLQAAAHKWGNQLRSSGVNVDLAPVMDTVPSASAAASNPPIGVYQREFGFTTRVVANHGTAFARGMTAAGVAPVIKHFPGLGRVRANTDTSRGVTDRITRRGDPYFQPFQEAIGAGVPFVMMSTAYYTHLDPHNPAAFSSFVIRNVLRGDLGFRGVVVSDDLGDARQVSPWRYGQRAVKFIRAGGDIVLDVNPGALPRMYHAVLYRARHNTTFRARVNRAALLVLQAKERQHLLGR